MGNNLQKLALCASLYVLTQQANGQYANRQLSNLTSPTEINVDLLPNISIIPLKKHPQLGSGTKPWENIWISKAYYLDSQRIIHVKSGSNVYTVANNFFVGIDAGNSDVSNIYNTGVGEKALNSLTSGFSNTAVGHYALRSITGAWQNTAVGYAALSYSTGRENTALGSQTLTFNSTGNKNTAIGSDALYANYEGEGNTALGYRAGYTSNTGSNNVYLGREANATAAFLESVAIGNNSMITASNQVRIGNSATTSIGGYRAWTNISDARYKREIQENVPGLSFIRKLRPVTYKLDTEGIERHIRSQIKTINGVSAGSESMRVKNSDQINTGFLAQEVEKAARELKYEFDGVDVPKNENDLYGLRYAEFVVPLVKAVQELAGILEEKEQEIAALKAGNEELLEAVKLLAAKQGTNLPIIDTKSSISQNTPNPFKGSTQITWNIPAQYNSAKIVVYDISGKMLKQINLGGKGSGTSKLELTGLPAGVYNYSLVVDGKVLQTKKLIAE